MKFNKWFTEPYFWVADFPDSEHKLYQWGIPDIGNNNYGEPTINYVVCIRCGKFWHTFDHRGLTAINDGTIYSQKNRTSYRHLYWKKG